MFELIANWLGWYRWFLAMVPNTCRLDTCTGWEAAGIYMHERFARKVCDELMTPPPLIFQEGMNAKVRPVWLRVKPWDVAAHVLATDVPGARENR